MISSFDVIKPCSCGNTPALWNLGGKVRFVCERCNREGPIVKEGKDAGLNAAYQWNKKVSHE